MSEEKESKLNGIWYDKDTGCFLIDKNDWR